MLHQLGQLTFSNLSSARTQVVYMYLCVEAFEGQSLLSSLLCQLSQSARTDG